MRLGMRLELGSRLMLGFELGCSAVFLLFWSGVVGWLEKSAIKLI